MQTRIHDFTQENCREEAEIVALTHFRIRRRRRAPARFLDTAVAPDGPSGRRPPGFLAAVLDYVAADEPLLLALARALETKPERSWRRVGPCRRPIRVRRWRRNASPLPGLPDLHADRRLRCEACGSPRLLRHPERDALAIAHVDCDAFFAAVEKRDDPGLADKPVSSAAAGAGSWRPPAISRGPTGSAPPCRCSRPSRPAPTRS